MSSKIIKIIVLTISIIIIFPMILATQSCHKINMEIFGFKPGEKTEAESAENEEAGSEDSQNTNNAPDDTGSPADFSTSGSNDSKNSHTVTDYTSAGDDDILKLRLYYTEAMKYFENQSYVVAEYYLNKIKYSYLVLQDHIFYYLAKSLLLQEKYDRSEEYYLKLIQNHPDSVWTEKASQEYADLFYVREDYISAENEYQHFIDSFPHSPYVPYCLFQLAICQENNGKKSEAFKNYKKIWLNYPLNEYSEAAWDNLIKLAEDSSIEPFVPTANQIYQRAEIFFTNYNYQNALKELNEILQDDYVKNLSLELHSKALFKKGRCYYNLGDYNQSRNYLLQSYQKSPSGSVADDSLYYIGRALTNLDLATDAISYYQKLLDLFPGSNYCDDALCRIGRIYSFREDFTNAASNFQRVSSDYPQGDKLADSLWELGWIQYKSADYNSAITTFSNYSSSYKGTSPEEKGLFWQAKCHQKLGENDKAASLYQQIINLNSYSYYTFASGETLQVLNKAVQIKEINTELNPENPQIAVTIPDIYVFLEQDEYFQEVQINHINKAIELLKLEFFNSASLEIEAASSEIEKEPARILEIATLFSKSNDYSSSIKIIHKNFNKLKSELDQLHMDYLYYLYYPYGYREFVQEYSSRYNLDPLFTLSVIRQESLFEPDAGSYAGAQGLMQIMPATGEGIARQIGIPNYNVNMLLDPDINIRMGTYYLKQQLNNFSQNEIYCLGAYNGGPGKMSEWISKRGSMDNDEFIENITYEQTREYIKIVMGNYYLYQMLYD